ncbi:uncharacterized protein LOC131671710 isoform X2 [Phymastichus coffea]|uniref:uncharacterized protein LOC131671710 isoform X2 n=1 Tax=Phymastichus coffea TaxID=108790 RepID=UPI00273B2FD3|nr:uncharacterized protein LOC131671710 isoform X2 [Phymastichus coffea]
MFSLRDSSSANSSGIDEDSFGWWIGAESQCERSEATTKDVERPRADSFVNSDADEICTCSDDYLLTWQNDEEQLVAAAAAAAESDEAEHIELCSFDGVGRSPRLLTDWQRQAVCYTPERLVRDDNYKILTPSARCFQPCYVNFRGEEVELEQRNRDKDISDGKIGAAQLVLLLESLQQGSFSSSQSGNRCCRCVRYGDGQVLLHNERCSRDESAAEKSSYMIRVHTNAKMPFSSEYGSYDEDHMPPDNNCHGKESSELCEDSSGVSSVDTITALHTDDWSCANGKTADVVDDLSTRLQPRRLSDEWAYTSFEYALVSPDRPDSEISSEMVALLADLDTERAQALLSMTDEDRFQGATHSGHDCFARLALAIEPDGRLVWRPRASQPRIPHSDPGPELEQLRDKIDRLHGSSRQLLEEMSSLRKDFAVDEWKINGLSDDVRKLRNEVCELRYLDDLLKLLRGELDRTSKRNWPFAIGNPKYGREEINLVV